MSMYVIFLSTEITPNIDMSPHIHTYVFMNAYIHVYISIYAYTETVGRPHIYLSRASYARH